MYNKKKVNYKYMDNEIRLIRFYHNYCFEF